MKKVVIIGAGNVATHLGMALKNGGSKPVQVVSRTNESAKELAMKLDCDYSTNLSDIKLDADLYIISVTDDAVIQVLENIELDKRMVVHTSGFLSMDILQAASTNYGVFYPLQTFSRSRNIDMKSVPICLEANDHNNLEFLKSITDKISKDVRLINSEQRKVLHLAAVFACNFPNFMYSIAERILQVQNMDFDILKPLILETAQKTQVLDPVKAQTGPAIRKDETILKAHSKMLNNYPELKELYEKISQQIIKYK